MNDDTRLRSLSALMLMLSVFAVSCSTTAPVEKSSAEPVDLVSSTPTHVGNPSAFDNITTEELRRLNLVASNLVSVLLQIPELQPMSVSLQVARPSTAFGNVLIRVLEDAGFALQLVQDDQGAHYVSYGRRFSETDSGPVTDFSVSIGDIQLIREFVEKPNGIFPASLMTIRGTAYIEDIQVPDTIFKEQGGEREADSFVSGARSEDATSAEITQVNVNAFDRLPVEKQTTRSKVIAEARQHYFDADRISPELSNFDRHRRTVLVFDDTDSLFLGSANKTSTRLLAREYNDGDLLVVKACSDVDGTNEKAHTRAIRVEEEFIGYGVPQSSVYLAPCSRTNYRHSADDSPVPVEVVHYRPKGS